MKVAYNKAVQRYIVSDRGQILHTCHTLSDALRLAGMEPGQEYMEEPPPVDANHPELDGSDIDELLEEND